MSEMFEKSDITAESTGISPERNYPAANRTSPIVILVIGMAGAGKTTLMHRINLHLLETNKKSYFINLDPATQTVPFGANIDIRDTVNYKEVMSQYGLGPNGAILTSLNLFATRFDQVIGLLEKRAENLDYIFIDTPGQIEAFTWSAGGQIISELLGSSFPTGILYVVDTPRCTSPTTFLSSMLYCCSVLYKTRLPIIACFNKTDAVPCEFALEWMTDFESYLTALDTDDEQYMGSLNRSLALVLDEFYRNISAVGVSAATGNGMTELFEKVAAVPEEYRTSYLPDLLSRIQEQRNKITVKQEKDLVRLTKDLKVSSEGTQDVSVGAAATATIHR